VTSACVPELKMTSRLTIKTVKTLMKLKAVNIMSSKFMLRNALTIAEYQYHVAARSLKNLVILVYSLITVLQL